MTTPPDYNKLAQQYLALWQEQIANAASDPAVSDNLSRMMAGWQSMMGAVAQASAMAGEDGDGEKSDDGGARSSGSAATADGAAAAAAPSGGADDAVRRLSERVADLEERLAALEAKLSG